PAAEAAPPPDDGYTLYGEETSAALFVELGRTELFGFVETYSTVRLVPWRTFTPDGRQTASIRLGLGYGSGLGSAVRQEAARTPADQLGLEFMGALMEQWEERLPSQRSADEARRFVALVERLAQLPFDAAPERVAYRYAQFDSGDLRLRRDDTGVYVFIPGEPGGWEPIPIERFKAGIEQAIARLDELVAAAPSIAMRQ